MIQIARGIIEQQSPERLLAIRGKLYELLTHCIPADVILKKLAFALIGLVDGQLKTDIAHWAALYVNSAFIQRRVIENLAPFAIQEHRIRTGSKAIYHLEAFVAKFMSIYKTFLLSVYG